MSTISYWGVDHGDEISKERKPKLDTKTKLRAGEYGGAGGLGLYYGATRAKKGRKAAVGARMYGRGALEGAGGASVGAGLGYAASRGNPTATAAGYYAGALTGTTHGNIAAFRNAKRRGDIKKPGQPGL